MELLTVITIILILAGLVLSLAGSAQYKAAFSRATSEIQALTVAANNYQIDNGTYPRVTTSSDNTVANPTDALDARASFDPNSKAYQAASLVLYQLLCGSYYIVTNGSTSMPTYYDPSNPPTGVSRPTAYFPFKNSQLKTGSTPTNNYINPKTVTALIDPFGFSYGYSTAYQADVDKINAGTGGSMTAPAHGYNPTFDLWSTAGYAGAGGKTYPNDIVSAKTQSTLWAKNW